MLYCCLLLVDKCLSPTNNGIAHIGMKHKLLIVLFATAVNMVLIEFCFLQIPTLKTKLKKRHKMTVVIKKTVTLFQSLVKQCYFSKTYFNKYCFIGSFRGSDYNIRELKTL